MRAQILLEKWLSSSRRNYAEGLLLFNLLATDTLKKRYKEYLNEANTKELKQFDQPMSILTNKLAQIHQMMRVNPDLFRDMNILEVGDNAPVDARIDTLSAQVALLESKLAEGDNQEVIHALRAEIETLRKKRGVEIVSEKDLPDAIRRLYERNKELTPLIASLHGEVSRENTPTAKRKKIVKQLCELDAERRSNWDTIDDWSVGKELIIPVDKPAYDSDPLVAGVQIARRILKLRENIGNCQKTMETADRDKIKENAAGRLAEYEAELLGLEERVTTAADIRSEIHAE